jgi:hypothetical protein
VAVDVSPFELDEARNLLTNAFLRAPRYPDVLAPNVRRTIAEIEPRMLSFDNQVAAVATTREDYGPAFTVFLETELDSEFDRNVKRIGEVLGLPARIFTRVSGPILPAARPAQGGDSLSGDGLGGDTGTFGCLVETALKDRLVLACNHTLAGVNRCRLGHDTVRQPGADDQGLTPHDTLGTLLNYQAIMLGGLHPNVMDAAVAVPTNLADVAAGIRGIGSITGVGTPLNYDQRVQKMGWKTKHTFGTYQFKLSYVTNFLGTGRALFMDQYGIVGDDPMIGFAERGDSGAVVLTEDTNELVGLLIGVADKTNMAIASPIEPILTAFGVTPIA